MQVLEGALKDDGDRGEASTASRAFLLERLRIEREAAPHIDEKPPRRMGPLLFGFTAAVLAAGVAAWFFLAQPGRPSVTVATVLPASGGARANSSALLEASGYVVARRQATVSSKITGRVVAVLIEEGQHVEEGQIIARLDSTIVEAQLKQAQARARSSEAGIRLADSRLSEVRGRVGRAKQLADRGVLAPQAMESALAELQIAEQNLEMQSQEANVAAAALEGAQSNLDDLVVRAPFAGVVVVKAAQPGEIVSPISAGGGFTRTGLGTIIDMDSLEVEVEVAETFINRVQKGMPVEVKLNAYQDWVIPAEVVAVIPTANRARATVLVRIGLKERDTRILPEMGARVAFLDADPRPATASSDNVINVIVPANGIEIDKEGGGTVFVVRRDGRIERREVRPGPRTPDGQVVQAGLLPGERVVVNRPRTLTPGQKVRALEEKKSS